MSLEIIRYTPASGRLELFLRTVWAVVNFSYCVVTLAFAHVLQMGTLLIYPFSKTLFRKINRRLANWWWGICYKMSRISGVTYEIHSTTPIPPKENIILLGNHQAATDIPAVFALAVAKGRLGDLKWFVKHEIKYFPLMGAAMMFLGCLFVKRSWEKDRARIEQTFHTLTSSTVPFWITMFPEGTRLKPSKQEKSFAMARRYGVEPFRHVLFPATKGFIAATSSLRPRLDAVYDATIFYPQGVPTLWDYLRGFVKKIDIYVERYPIASLPEDQAELAKWLVERFEVKEKLLAELKGGAVPGR
jgi:1-acyl-sn-glycerol-3-phosphate acyltransferase